MATSLRYLLLAGLLLLPAPLLAGDDAGESAVDNDEQANDFTAITRGHGLSLHKSNYILPLTWSDDYDGESSEVIFQLSIKQRLFINNLYAAYTQKSFWQAWNRQNSAPFRETNYNPELFYRWLPGDDMFRRWHLDRWGFDAGIEHESNGQTVPASRSLNRVYFAPFRQSSDGRDLLYFKVWHRLPEKPKNSPTDPGGDDNPDYYRYFGWTQLDYLHYFNNQWQIHTMTRGNLDTGKGALELRLSIPVPDRSFFWAFNVFTGYGENLLDYNRETTRVGIGFMFNR